MWRIYYGDDNTYEGDPFLAPASNVQVILVPGPGKFRKIQGKDYYCWMGDLGWIGTDIGGMFDYLATHSGPCKVLQGRTIHDDTFQSISRRASLEGLPTSS